MKQFQTVKEFREALLPYKIDDNFYSVSNYFVFETTNIEEAHKVAEQLQLVLIEVSLIDTNSNARFLARYGNLVLTYKVETLQVKMFKKAYKGTII